MPKPERRGAGGGDFEIDPKLLDLLACPLTKGPLAWDPEKGELLSRVANLAYPVRDGIPIMLPSEARQVDPDEWNSAASRKR